LFSKANEIAKEKKRSMDKKALDLKLNYLDSLTPQSDEVFVKPQAKALVIDLSAESSYDWEIPTCYLESYVSGPALGARLWACFVGSDINLASSYETNNPVVFTTSSVTNSGMPGGEVLACTFRSPTTQSLMFNLASNTVGMRLNTLGYAALIITGRLRRPTIISISKTDVSFNTSEVFIGFSISQVEKLVETNATRTAMSIGIAGELKVPFSVVVCEGSSLGRGGLGEVFGFKNIKSIVIEASQNENINEFDETQEESFEREASFDKLYKACELSAFCKELKEKGSSYLVSLASKYGWAPVDNFRYRTDPRLFHLGGDETKRRYGTICACCTNCPIQCKHVTKDGYLLPNFEAILMLGSNVGCFDMDSIMQRYALCIDLGLDPISMGNVLGWLKQAKEQSIIDIIDDNFLFTDSTKVLALIEMTAKRINVGEQLSFGTLALAKLFRGESFAYTIRGLECGPYDYRGSFSLALSNVMGFNIDNLFETVAKLCIKDYANWAIFNENITLGLSSYGVQPSLIYPTVVDGLKRNTLYLKLLRAFPKTMMKSLKPNILAECISSVLKRPVIANDIIELGQRTWYLTYEINYAMGFDMLEEHSEDSASLFPLHFCIDPNSNSRGNSIVPFFDLLQDYRHLRKQSIINKISELDKD